MSHRTGMQTPDFFLKQVKYFCSARHCVFISALKTVISLPHCSCELAARQITVSCSSSPKHSFGAAEARVQLCQSPIISNIHLHSNAPLISAGWCREVKQA